MSDSLAAIIGSSRAAHAIRDFARLAARVDATVLITGETGTGKGILAAAIHDNSRRARGPFIAVNCAGVPESLFESEFFGHARGAFTGAHQTRRGLFEQAHGGTLFLDEIGELTLTLQAKLLTTLEERIVRRLGAESQLHVDVRVIAATGVDLETAIAQRSFRLDLYHRLLVLSFHMPALRERGSDIAVLARHFLCIYAARHDRHVGDFTPAALHVLEHNAWPGNVRQLAHAVEAAVLSARGPQLTPADLPRRILLGVPPQAAEPARYSFYGTASEERARIVSALRACGGNLTRTARALGMSRNTLRTRIRQLGIDSPRAGVSAT
jgi:DNA-binding NtrC family response regulator